MFKKIGLATVIGLIGVVVVFLNWQAFGSKVKGKDLARISTSANY